MIIYLYGPDAYRRNERLHGVIVAGYRKKYPQGTVEAFYLDKPEAFAQLKDFSANQSLFAKTKLGLVYEPGEAPKEFKELLKNLLEEKNTTLVIVADKKLTKEYDFLLKEPVQKEEFAILEGAQLNAFIKKQAITLGVKLTAEEVTDLAEGYGGDTWATVNELTKRSLGAKPDEAFGSPEFFPLVQTVKGSGPLGRRLQALYYLLENNEPAAIFNIVASMTSGSSKIAMADYDIAIKSGKLEYPEALLDFVLQTS